jgi:hypothetical protein
VSGPGAALWTRLYGSAGANIATAIVVDSEDGLVVAGELTSNSVVDFGCGTLPEASLAGGMFVVKLDRCRACTWSRAFDGMSAARVAATPAGHVVVGGLLHAGSFDLGGITLASPGPAGFVAELDAHGTPLWARAFPAVHGVAGSQVEGLAVDAQGAVLVAGTIAGSIDFGGTVLTSSAGTGVFAGKLGPGGTPAWSRAFGPNMLSVDLATGDSGELLLTGTFTTPVDFGCGPLPGVSEFVQPFVAALDASGACRWSRSFPAPKAARAASIAAAGSSQIVVSGSFAGTIDFGGGSVTASAYPELYVAGLGADGSFRWGRGFEHVEGGSLAMNAAGDVFLNGTLTGPVDLGGGPFGAGGTTLLGSLDPPGASAGARRSPCPWGFKGPPSRPLRPGCSSPGRPRTPSTSAAACSRSRATRTSSLPSSPRRLRYGRARWLRGGADRLRRRDRPWSADGSGSGPRSRGTRSRCGYRKDR